MNPKEVLIIGGSPCSGKSTIASYLGTKYNYQVIHLDEYMDKHIQEADEIHHPIMYQWKTGEWEELLSRDVFLQFEEEILFYEEEFEVLKRDIYFDITSEKVIVEGCAMMPHLIQNLFQNQKVLYLVPSERFQLEMYNQREWARELVKNAIDPMLAFDNWMQRDVLFSDYVSKVAKKRNYTVIKVTKETSLDQNIKQIENYFNLKHGF